MTERLEEINAVVKSQKEAVRKLSYNDLKWLIAQAKRTEGLEEVIEGQNKDVASLLSENQRLKQALEYIQRAIYTQHCTKNHKWNTEFEKGQISGLIQASNIVDKAIRKVEGEV